MSSPGKQNITKSLNLILLIYSIFILFIYFIVKMIFSFSKNSKQFESRVPGKRLEKKLRVISSEYQDIVVFFCSSAGEYEQAIPLMDRFEKLMDRKIVIFFFSQSGVDYAVAKKEKRFYFKSPIDLYWQWEKIFSVLKPSIVVVVRYELWPSFLAIANCYSMLILIDAVEFKVPRCKLQWIIKKKFLSFFDLLFVVNERTKEIYRQQYMLSQPCCVVGDTKYDRVYERAISKKREKESLQQMLELKFGVVRRFVVGSGWHRDISLSIEAYRMLKKSNQIPDWQLILVPHHTDLEMIRWIEKECQKYGKSHVRFTQLLLTDEKKYDDIPILIVDRIGILAEIYGVADLALVGGALHFRIHNVLEPAVHGIPICFGPKYDTSIEAKNLVDEGLAYVISGSNDIYDFWEKNKYLDDCHDKKIQRNTESLVGAANRIFNFIAIYSRLSSRR